MNHYIKNLYVQHGLSEESSREEIEAKALELLASQRTKFDGAEIALGRRIDSSERDVVMLFAFADARAAYGALLIQKAMEK